MGTHVVQAMTGRLPLVVTRIRRPGQHIARAYRALVDSGSTWTLAHVDIAAALGVTPAELDAGRTEWLGGVGGTTARASGLRMHLAIGPKAPDLVELADAWVFFTTARLPGGVDLLLGQHDALERLTFAQMNHPPAPGFVLHRPIARRSQ